MRSRAQTLVIASLLASCVAGCGARTGLPIAASPSAAPSSTPARTSSHPRPIAAKTTRSPQPRVVFSPPVTGALKVPTWVELRLEAPRREGTRHLVLTLETDAGSDGCDSVGPLQISWERDQDLNIDIHGFDYSRSSSEDACLMFIPKTSAQVDLDLAWLRSAPRHIDIALAGKKNTFTLSLDRYVATVATDRAVNVMTGGSSGPSETMTTIMYPADVGHLYLAGHVEDKDYTSAMRAFAVDHGWASTEERYDIPDTDPNTANLLWIVVRDRELPAPSTGVRVGRIGTADVYLASED
jgi:hypothetical protein